MFPTLSLRAETIKKARTASNARFHCMHFVCQCLCFADKRCIFTLERINTFFQLGNGGIRFDRLLACQRRLFLQGLNLCAQRAYAFENVGVVNLR